MIHPDETKTWLVSELLLNGEAATSISVVNDGKQPDHWLIVLDGGWFQTIVATCDYAHHASGVAHAISGALDCDLILPAELEDKLAGERTNAP